MSDHFDPDSNDAVLSRVTTVLERVEKRLDEGDKTFKEHEQRIQKLEGWRYYVIGIAIGGGVVLRAIWEWLSGHSK